MTADAAGSTETIAASVRTLIYRGCLLLDHKDFKSWLDLCSPDFHYTVATYSPEIRREQVWLDHDYESMESLIRMLPRHNSDQTPLMRHATVYTVDWDPAAGEATAVTSVAIFATTLDGGETTLFALARYHDIVDTSGEEPRLRRRTVRLETRSLGIGKHWPL